MMPNQPKGTASVENLLWETVTSDCPTLPRLLVAAREGWTAEERAHVQTCGACERALIRCWSYTHPPKDALIHWVNDQLTGSEASAVLYHLELDRCDRCRDLVAALERQRPLPKQLPQEGAVSEVGEQARARQPDHLPAAPPNLGGTMAIDWSRVKLEHVQKACKLYDSRDAVPARPAKSTFLLLNNKSYPAKFIRGLAYRLATGIQLDPNHDYQGGMETVRFFKRLGFKTRHEPSASVAATPLPQPPHLSGSAAPPAVGPQPGAVCQVCQALHKWLNSRPRFGFPYPKAKIPWNGIYFLFEDGEKGHGADRIVRIGTHTGDDQLPSRLEQHFLKEKKDRSIFRKNIGRCLLNRNHDPFLKQWELDLTTHAAKVKYHGTIDMERQKQIERQVSDYIRSHLRFVVLEVPDKAQRLELESKITSTISLCAECRPSATWLGLHSPKPKIRESGLWQVNELYKVPLSVAELNDLLQMT